jgi:hypothetical protein
VRWKIDKKNYLSVKYQPASGKNSLAGDVISKMNTQRLAADLNMRTKFLKNELSNFVSLAYLHTGTVTIGMPDEVYRTVQLNTTHSLSKGSNQIFINTGFNYALQTGALPLFNNSFSLEAGIGYDLKFLKLSSALNYNMVSQWYSQIVLKQSISGQIGNRVEANISVDAAKNLQLLQPFPVWGSRMDISLRYLIF